MEELTPAERKAVKRALLIFKRFWNATPNSVDENAEADKLIEAVEDVAKLMEDQS